MLCQLPTIQPFKFLPCAFTLPSNALALDYKRKWQVTNSESDFYLQCDEVCFTLKRPFRLTNNEDYKAADAHHHPYPIQNHFLLPQ